MRFLASTAKWIPYGWLIHSQSAKFSYNPTSAQKMSPPHPVSKMPRCPVWAKAASTNAVILWGSRFCMLAKPMQTGGGPAPRNWRCDDRLRPKTELPRNLLATAAIAVGLSARDHLLSVTPVPRPLKALYLPKYPLSKL